MQLPVYEQLTALSPGEKATITPTMPDAMTHMRIEISRGQRGDYGFEASISVDRPNILPHRDIPLVEHDAAFYARCAVDIARWEIKRLETGEDLPLWSSPIQRQIDRELQEEPTALVDVGEAIRRYGFLSVDASDLNAT